MSHINIEIKARTTRADEIRKILLDKKAEYKGTDIQTDTYFNIASGRLKLRQGNIENSLIYYYRENVAGLKQSDFDLLPVDNGDALKSMLTKALGVKIEVKKSREIYYIENVKFHIDTLEGLGNFVEIEAGNMHGNLSVDALREQCAFYMRDFGITDADLVPVSYSDMLPPSLSFRTERFGTNPTA
ncbi:MAG TPA: class IV adenylate cyclase [Flavitalea sp.]|nr:class IV adenylate cyclase [Flavitalea sp.]